MITQAGDLGLTLDTGTNRPGIVQRHDGKDWRDFERDGEPVRWPVKLETLPPGRYRVRSALACLGAGLPTDGTG